MDVPPQYEAEGNITIPPANTNILQFILKNSVLIIIQRFT